MIRCVVSWKSLLLPLLCIWLKVSFPLRLFSWLWIALTCVHTAPHPVASLTTHSLLDFDLYLLSSFGDGHVGPGPEPLSFLSFWHPFQRPSLKEVLSSEVLPIKNLRTMVPDVHSSE